MSNLPAGLASGLVNNGGPTQTIALILTSPAVNAIPRVPMKYCTDFNGNPITVDQRGLPRPAGLGCDIGGYEQESVFDSFSGKLQLSGPSLFAVSFDLTATFALDRLSNGINPATEVVMLSIGTYNVTIPAGSFQAIHGGGYAYQGTIAGVALQVQLVPQSGSSWQLKAQGGPANFAGTPAGKLKVTLIIGDDVGSTNI